MSIMVKCLRFHIFQNKVALGTEPFYIEQGNMEKTTVSHLKFVEADRKEGLWQKEKKKPKKAIYHRWDK